MLGAALRMGRNHARAVCPVSRTDTGQVTSLARIDGLDVARALAILGMVAAHVGDEGTRGSDSDGWGWIVISHGFPSALFAVLAGVSMTLMLTRRGTVAVADVSPDDRSRTRVRIIVRAVILIGMGGLLAGLGTTVVVILAHLGVMFILAIPLLRLPTRVLVAGAVALAIIGGWLARGALDWADGIGIGSWPVIDTLWSAYYPALAWMAYIMAGLVIGRLDLRRTVVAWRLVAVGVALAAATRAIGWGTGDEDEDPWLTTEPHSYSAVEMLSNIGVACAIIGLTLLLARRWPRALWPFMASGSMALTLYVAHLIVIAIVGYEMVQEPSNVSFVALTLGLVTFACIWRPLLGQGPLERLLTVASTTTANAVLPAPPSRT